MAISFSFAYYYCEITLLIALKQVNNKGNIKEAYSHAKCKTYALYNVYVVRAG